MKIAGMVTLYHPDKTISNNIMSYLPCLDKLYVVDNTPNMNNEDLLPKSPKIEYIFNNENKGIATALNIAAMKAIKDKYKWLLTMDQDSCFKKNALEELILFLNNYKNKKEIGLISPWHKLSIDLVKPDSDIDYPVEVMTSGNIINLDAYKDINGFKDWLFIDAVDFEYCMNLNIHNYKVIRLNKVSLEHDLGAIEVKKILGHKFICSNHNHVRKYYIVRNTLTVCKMYEEYFPDYMKYLRKSVRGQFINTILIEKNKFKKLRAMIRGLRDYKKGIKGIYPYKK